jgi:hypothetical protein
MNTCGSLPIVGSHYLIAPSEDIEALMFAVVKVIVTGNYSL